MFIVSPGRFLLQYLSAKKFLQFMVLEEEGTTWNDSIQNFSTAPSIPSRFISDYSFASSTTHRRASRVACFRGKLTVDKPNESQRGAASTYQCLQKTGLMWNASRTSLFSHSRGPRHTITTACHDNTLQHDL